MAGQFAAVRKIPELDPSNDGRHTLADNPFARESIPYVFVLEEERIVGCPYTWVDREGVAGGIFYLFGPGIGDEIIVDHFESTPVPAHQNFDDWRVRGLHFKQDMDLMGASVSVRGRRTRLECRFDALHPAYAYGFHPDGCPSYVADNRIEQTGRIKGVLTIDQREIAFDSIGWRDHSWGTRDWQTAQHWKWLHAQAGPDLLVHFFDIQALGTKHLRGYVLRDGVFAEVASVDVDFTLNEQFLQKTISCSIRDTAGRTTRLEGDFFGHYPLIPAPHTTLIESGMTCKIDGRHGAGYVEFLWPTTYFEHVKENRRLSGTR